MNIKYKTAINTLILLSVFTASVFVRLPNIKNQPLGRHHEWITAHTLLTNKIWFEKGLNYYHYAPVYTFDYTADRTHPMFLNMEDENKNHYYVSYPPFGFYFPYAIFKITNVKPNEAWMRGISLTIQLVSGFLIFFFIYVIAKRKIADEVYIPAHMAFLFYVFCSGNLWFNANLYFADFLAQPFFIGLSLVSYLFYYDRLVIKPAFQLLILCLLAFLIVYTEWIGVFLIISISFLFLIKSFREKRFILPLFLLPLSGLLAIGLIVFQYSSISSFDNFLETSVSKYKQRSGNDETAQGNLGFKSAQSYENLKKFHADAYYHLFKTIAALLVLCILLFKFIESQKLKDGMLAVYLSLIPVIMHIFTFFNFNIWHDFSVHKASFFLSLFAGILLVIIYACVEKLNNRWLTISSIIVAVVFSGYFVKYSVRKYLEINDPNWKETLYLVLGESIKNYAQSDEAVFTNHWAYPELMQYAERNPFQTQNISESINYMKGIKGIDKGIFFKVENQSLKYIARFNSKGDSTLVWKLN